jgi:hypothetical protein
MQQADGTEVQHGVVTQLAQPRFVTSVDPVVAFACAPPHADQQPPPHRRCDEGLAVHRAAVTQQHRTRAAAAAAAAAALARGRAGGVTATITGVPHHRPGKLQQSGLPLDLHLQVPTVPHQSTHTTLVGSRRRWATGTRPSSTLDGRQQRERREQQLHGRHRLPAGR